MDSLELSGGETMSTLRRDVYDTCAAHSPKPDADNFEILDHQKRCDWCRNQITTGRRATISLRI